MMATGNLYNETLRSALREEAPLRESKAWIGWLIAGLVVGGAVVDVWHMYQERLARDERFRQEGFVDQGNGIWVRERPGQRTVITLSGVE